MMRAFAIMLALGSLIMVPGTVGLQTPDPQPSQDPIPAPRFEVIDLYIDSGEVALAAYQVEIRATSGRAQLVGVEGGAPAAYQHPPYYDPQALHEDQLNDRIVIAAIGDGPDLPRGEVRIARLHVALQGEVEFHAVVKAAGDADGDRIDVAVEIRKPEPLSMHLEPD